MSTDRRRLASSDAVWAAVVLVLTVLAAGWTALGFALRSECGDDPGGCDDWLVPDAISTGLAVGCLLAWFLGRRRGGGAG